ncbi:hypothetical protein MGI18_04310 [Bacillus sp. OVS6]|nr:hypothetical protein MGI18_04310 [Bacillus sp. OVS6]
MAAALLSQHLPEIAILLAEIHNYLADFPFYLADIKFNLAVHILDISN